ncbi:MAG: sigma-70 family RNA polymerase sigma factor [Methylococcaceae bacterium]
MASNKDLAHQKIAATRHHPLPTKLELNSLIDQVASSQDKQAFEKLFRYFGPKLQSFMHRSGAEPALAEELMQETMIEVWRKAGLFNPQKGNLTTWVFTIARNIRIDKLRRADASMVFVDIEQENSWCLSTQETDANRWVDLETSIKILTAQEQEVLQMAYIEGFTHREISQRLNQPLGTIKSRLKRTLAKIRQELNRHE